MRACRSTDGADYIFAQLDFHQTHICFFFFSFFSFSTSLISFIFIRVQCNAIFVSLYFRLHFECVVCAPLHSPCSTALRREKSILFFSISYGAHDLVVTCARHAWFEYVCGLRDVTWMPRATRPFQMKLKMYIFIHLYLHFRMPFDRSTWLYDRKYARNKTDPKQIRAISGHE